MEKQMKSAIELARHYRLAVQQLEHDTVYAIECQLDARDAELAQLRAELARLRPLAEAAMSYRFTVDDGKKMTYAKEYNIQCELNDLGQAALAYARAQAQDGAA